MKNLLVANKYKRVVGKDGKEYLILPKEFFECNVCGEEIEIKRDKNDKIIKEYFYKCKN